MSSHVLKVSLNDLQQVYYKKKIQMFQFWSQSITISLMRTLDISIPYTYVKKSKSCTYENTHCNEKTHNIQNYFPALSDTDTPR